MNAPLKTDTQLTVDYIRLAILSRFTPIRYLTPQLLTMQLDNFHIGWIAMMALSWEAIEQRDDVLKGVAAKRKKTVARLKRESLVLDDSAEAKSHAQALDEFYDNMTVVNALDQNERGGYSLMVRQMMDSMGKYYAVHEIVWQPDPETGRLTAELRFAPLWFFENRTGRLQFLPFVGSAEGSPLEEGGWMITKGDGLMEACCVAWMFKHLPLKDWLVYSEKFGIPPVIGRTAAGPDSEAGQSMAAAVAAFGNEFASVIYGDDGSGKIEMLEVGKNAGQLPFPALIERMDRAMCALWRGSDLSTMSADNKGASVQDGEGDILLVDDAGIISETLQLYIDRYVILQKFGTDRPLAKSTLVVPEKENVETDIKVDELLLKSGARLGERERLEHYGRPVIKPSDLPLHNPATITERVQDAVVGKPPATEDLPNARYDAFLTANARATLNQWLVNAAMQSGDMETVSYIGKAVDEIANATSEDLKPLADRLRKALSVETDAEFANEFNALLADRGELAKHILTDPSAAAAFERALGGALFNGLTTKP